MYYLKFLYIFSSSSSKYIFFHTNLNAKVFLIDEIQVSEKLENNFRKHINEGLN